jgi:tetratricopeptide (TPR) repeat protein
MKPFFLSHSSLDKEFVRQVAAALGPDRCWLDEWEMIGGDELFQNIDSAIESAATKVFTLFWSESSSASPWVGEEVANARLRRLRRKDMDIVPVKLDQTEMPLWMSRLVYLDAKIGASAVADSLISRLGRVEQLHHDLALQAENVFLGRQKEMERIERAFYEDDVACVAINGLPGIGKSSLCRQVLQQRLPHLRPIWVDFEASASPALFFSTLAQSLSLRLPREVLSSNNWSAYWTEWIFPALDPATNVIILDGLNFAVDADGAMPDWLQLVFGDCMLRGRADSLPLIFLASRTIDFSVRLAKKVVELHVPRLSAEDITRTLRLRMERSVPKRTATRDQLEQAAGIISGYPLGAQLWTAYASRVGIELALLDPAPVQKQVQEMVGDVLAKCRLTAAEQHALLLLSVSRFPLPVEVLVKDLGIGSKELISLQKSMLLDPALDGLGVHGLVANYLVNSITSHQEVRKAHEVLGEFFRKKWKESPEGVAISAELASKARYHLLACGRIDEASTVSWGAVEEAKRAIAELYRTRQDNSVIAVGESVENMGSRDAQVMFYYALSLGRRKASENEIEKAIDLFREILGAHPKNGFYWSAFGDVLARNRRIEEAKDAYIKARALRPDDVVPSERLGELLLRQGDLTSASVFLSEAFARSPQDPRVVASYASLLQRKGQQSEAFRIVSEGLRRRPDDIPLNHRAGLLLKNMGKQMEALQYLTRAAKGDSLPASYLSLADLYLEMGKLAEAKRSLDSYPGAKSAAYYNVAGNIARREERFLEAEELLRKCLRMEGEDVVLLGSIASLKIAQAEKALEMLAYTAAKAYIVDAEEAIRKGLTMENDNQTLLWLKADADHVRLRALKADS